MLSGSSAGSGGNNVVIAGASIQTFLKAINDGNLEKAKTVAFQININVKEPYGAAAFYMAINKGYSTIVEWLLSLGADTNTRQDGNTPLLIASQNGHSAIVKLLLQSSDIDVNVASKDGITPLIHASENGHTAIVKLLLNTPGILLNQSGSDEQGCPTALTEASKKGHSEIVELLLQASGIDINHAAMGGMTPLIYATRAGHTAVVQLLLDAPGIDVNQTNVHGNSPLGGASGNGHTEIVKHLLNAPGINVNHADKVFNIMIRTPPHLLLIIKLYGHYLIFSHPNPRNLTYHHPTTS